MMYTGNWAAYDAAQVKLCYRLDLNFWVAKIFTSLDEEGDGFHWIWSSLPHDSREVVALAFYSGAGRDRKASVHTSTTV